ncbi:MAG TPA: ATP-binding cassette domain-containing protein, partial [Acidimicrobiales bacterium]
MSRTHPKPTGSSATRPAHPAKPVKAPAQKATKSTSADAAAKKAPPAPKRPTGAVLWAAGLTKEYGDLPALAPLDLTIPEHQSVVLIGHNGSGKTTFLRMAAGLLEPTAGIVELGGHPVGSVEA